MCGFILVFEYTSEQNLFIEKIDQPIYVPLQFWFSKHKISLPLIAIEAWTGLNLRSIEELNQNVVQ